MWAVELQNWVQILAHLLVDGWPCMASLWLKCLLWGMCYCITKQIENSVDIFFVSEFSMNHHET